MPNEIQYDFSYLDEAIAKVKSLKSKIPVKKGTRSEYTWDYLYTGKSKGDTLDALIEMYSLTEQRAYQIDELLDNVYNLLKNAKEKMKGKDKDLAKEYKKL